MSFNFRYSEILEFFIKFTLWDLFRDESDLSWNIVPNGMPLKINVLWGHIEFPVEEKSPLKFLKKINVLMAKSPSNFDLQKFLISIKNRIFAIFLEMKSPLDFFQIHYLNCFLKCRKCLWEFLRKSNIFSLWICCACRS